MADISCTKSGLLRDKKIALCLTGSVAIFKGIELARELIRHGANLIAIMSSSAKKFVSPKLVEWAIGKRPITKLSGVAEHTLGANVDIVIVYPATANTISKIATGVADTTVTLVVSCALGANRRVIIAPAMHKSMYDNPIFQENMQKLRSCGVEIIEPIVEEGKAKIASINDVIERILTAKEDLKGLKILITAGPTREYLDPVRFLSNASSGKMGFALALEAHNRGAQVTLVKGPTALRPPLVEKIIEVTTTEEMHNAVCKELSKTPYDVVILSAAPVDFKFNKEIKGKIKSDLERVDVSLVRTPKIAEIVRKLSPSCVLVGFKAEYNVSREILIQEAKRKLEAYNMDMIVANDLAEKGAGFSVDTNRAIIIGRDFIEELPLMSKRELAGKILDKVVRFITRQE